MKATRKISEKIFYRIFLGTLCIILTASAINYYYTRKILIRLYTSLVEQTLHSAYNKIEAAALPVIQNAENLLFTMELTGYDTTGFLPLMRETYTQYPVMLNTSLLVYPDQGDTLNITLSPQTDQAGEIYGFHVRDGFQKDSNRFDPLSGKYRVSIQSDTISLNYYLKENSARIFLSYDLDLSFYTKTLDSLTPELQCRHYLFDDQLNSIFSSSGISDSISWEDQVRETDRIKEHIRKGKDGLLIFPEYSRGQALYVARIGNTSLLLASVIELTGIINKLRKINLIVILISISGLIVLVLIQRRSIYRLTRPLEELIAISNRIRNGSLHADIPDYKTDSDTAQLALNLRFLQDKLHRYVSNLNTTMKQKRAMTHELNLAERIQLDMLPDLRHALTEIPEIDIYSMLRPARGVAGDFFDYSFPEENKFFFIIGDVSGKGMPAALFMVKTLTLFRTEIKAGNHVSGIFSAVSDLLVRNNDEGMFVTAIGGILDYRTGELEICDAGHNTPLMGGINSEFEYFNLKKNLPLGVSSNVEYVSTTLNLTKGDTLFLYTDGLSEAVNIHDEMFESERIHETLAGRANQDLEKIFIHVQQRLDQFVGNASQSDDITTILLRYQGG